MHPARYLVYLFPVATLLALLAFFLWYRDTQRAPLARRLLASGDGQSLLGLLTREDGGDSLRQAAAKAAKGDTKALSAMLSGLMESPEGAALIRRLGDRAKQQGE